MKKPISIGLSPNTQKDDVRLAFRLLCVPWRYVRGNAIKELERWFRTYFKASSAISFVNARSALYAILHCLDIGQGDEVILQAFTCVAVPNAVIATQATPIYVDIDQTVNIDPACIEKKITKKTKAIIVQHTFGIPANMRALTKIALQHKLLLIEDVAHTIGGEYNGKKLGTFGIAACYSFGRDKAFSAVFGGMAVTSDKILGAKLRSYQKQRNFPSYFWVVQQLFYPLLSACILNLYYVFSLGKLLHVILRKFHIFSYPVTLHEKKGKFNTREAKRFPNALAALALFQLKKLKIYNQTRAEITAYYAQALGTTEFQFEKNIPLLRFPISVVDKKKIKAYFAKYGIYLGDWYTQAIDPLGTEFRTIGYSKGSCPHAESYAKTILNLPTYPTMSLDDAQSVVGVWKEYHNT